MRTPATRAGLTSMDGLTPGVAAVRAWTTPGPHPSWHRAAQRVVAAAMPHVAAALERGDAAEAVREWHRRTVTGPVRRHRVRGAMPVLARALDRARA